MSTTNEFVAPMDSRHNSGGSSFSRFFRSLFNTWQIAHTFPSWPLHHIPALQIAMIRFFFEAEATADKNHAENGFCQYDVYVFKFAYPFP